MRPRNVAWWGVSDVLAIEAAGTAPPLVSGLGTAASERQAEHRCGEQDEAGRFWVGGAQCCGVEGCDEEIAVAVGEKG